MKKTFGVVTAAVLAAASIAGCSGNKAAETTAAETTAAASSAAETTAETTAEETTASSGELQKIVVGASPAPHAEILKAANDVLLIQFFQDNVITLGLNTEYYLPETMSKREIQRLFEMKPYKGTIIA